MTRWCLLCRRLPAGSVRRAPSVPVAGVAGCARAAAVNMAARRASGDYLVVVPEGYGLLLFQDGKITGFAAEPGGYEWKSDDINSKSIFVGDGLVDSLIKQSWERFKFGGRPGSQQTAIFVALKELAKRGWKPRGTLVYLACADEEMAIWLMRAIRSSLPQAARWVT